MLVICEECGRRYQVDPSKIKGERAKVKCKACNHVFIVKKQENTSLSLAAEEITKMPTDLPPEVKEPEEEKKDEGTRKGAVEVPKPSQQRLGLRVKMIILFFLIPLLLMTAAGVFHLKGVKELSVLITNESSHIVKGLAEQIIEEKARAVATQIQLYLLAYPNLKKEEFNNHEEFKKIAVQKVGKTGYTALYELPDKEGIWRTWAHINPKIIGIDMSKLKKPLGKYFAGFWKVFTGVRGNRPSKGYYNWKDQDGEIRPKFMVCAPVEGTRYVVAATTYLDEFTRPLKELEVRAQQVTADIRNTSMGIMAVALFLMAAVVSLYGHRLTTRIKTLTDLAERISVGELDAEVDIKSKDELGDLAEAISRMQESIRISIERLRRRR